MRNGFGLGIDEKFVGVLPTRFAIERRAPLAETFFQFFDGHFGELPDAVDAQRVQTRFGDFADPGNFSNGKRREKFFLGARRNPDQSARLGLFGSYFCDQSRGRESGGTRKLRGAPDFLDQFVGGGERRAVHAFGAGEIEIGFVDRSHFDNRRIFRQDCGDAVAPFAIKIVVAIEENCVRAQAARGSQRHGGLNAVFSRFVAGCGDDAALVGLAPDDHRLAAKLGPCQQFDGNEERVHIDMQDRRRKRQGIGSDRIVFRAKGGQLGHGGFSGHYHTTICWIALLDRRRGSNTIIHVWRRLPGGCRLDPEWRLRGSSLGRRRGAG